MNATTLRRVGAPSDLTVRLIEESRGEPIVYDNVRPDLCARLAHVIMDRMQVERGSTPSLNVGGWKSSETIFQWPDPAIQQLHAAISEMIGARPIGWAMVNWRGSHHPRHQHAIARLVGVYYVTIGDERNFVPTIFETSQGELAVDPHPGRVALSPGEMFHRVPRYDGEVPRISIAFDVRR